MLVSTRVGCQKRRKHSFSLRPGRQLTPAKFGQFRQRLKPPSDNEARCRCFRGLLRIGLKFLRKIQIWKMVCANYSIFSQKWIVCVHHCLLVAFSTNQKYVRQFFCSLFLAEPFLKVTKCWLIICRRHFSILEVAVTCYLLLCLVIFWIAMEKLFAVDGQQSFFSWKSTHFHNSRSTLGDREIIVRILPYSRYYLAVLLCRRIFNVFSDIVTCKLHDPVHIGTLCALLYHA